MTEDKGTGSWWKTIPGVLTGIAATITALGTLVVALSQAGLLGSGGSSTSASADSSRTAVSAVRPSEPHNVSAGQTQTAGIRASEPIRPPTGRSAPQDLPTTGRDLLAALAKANVRNSVGDARMLQWLDAPDRRYRRLAEASLGVLGGRSLSANGADLDKINYLYLRALGVPGDDMPIDHRVDRKVLQTALIESYNDKNGTNARSLGEVVK